MKSCSADELTAIRSILFKKGESYSVRIGKLHAHEGAKACPERFPTNEDSLGIEIVGAFDTKGNAYASVSAEQNATLAWLVEVLSARLSLGEADVVAHGVIGYKQPTEGSTARWKKP